MLNKQDTGALKGIAILCIAIHNFCHWLPMAVHENEYVFRLEDSLKLLHHVQMLHPQVLLNVFFSLRPLRRAGVSLSEWLRIGLQIRAFALERPALRPFFARRCLIRARSARWSALCTHSHCEIVATHAAGAVTLRDHAILPFAAVLKRSGAGRCDW